MASMTASVGKRLEAGEETRALKSEIHDSILRLFGWLEKNDYRGYDTFDGLNARLVRPLTFENKLLRTVLLQGVRRFPLNLRPLLGVDKGHSTKGMGFLARGFIRLHQATGDPVWAEKAEFALQWLMDHRLPGYSGDCWGNHFDYQSRSSFIAKGVPTVVWTSLIGHAFLDGYEHFRKDEYLQIAVSICEHIVRDLRTYPEGKASASTIPRARTAGFITQTRLAAVFLPAPTPTRRMNLIELWRKEPCSTRRSINARTDHGITEKRRICTGLTISIRATFWTVSSITPRALTIIGSTRI